ncbi:hypothetical protein N0V82_006757 [Gnomoniopsis sp. IMI 355080]|nr:hypothetical protein N0V82_006757 [Gnomoniopsis sp. IMI 355080]
MNTAMDFSDSDESPRLSGTFDLFNQEIELPAIDNQPARRLSMEEDYFYEQVMTFAQPLQPPAYHAATHGTYEGPSRKGKEAVLDDNLSSEQELLPAYSCDVHMETVFQMKMEIEDAVKRAEYRNWRTMFVELQGTALHIYSARKKDFGWGKSRMHGPDVRPDNPSWLRKGSLERSYSLQHADVGIAADYHKRRYVIRIRAETDQFLISCVELQTFVKWLECLFAAIDVAIPIDERDFPRDQSIPRIQRLRWLRGHLSDQDQTTNGGAVWDSFGSPPTSPLEPAINMFDAQADEMSPDRMDMFPDGSPFDSQEFPMPRFSTASTKNDDLDQGTGKWRPRHLWSTTHDMVYAKLCYAVLLFKSPRKSNFVIFKGQRWHIDWSTGQMSRVQPPSYGEPEFWGPWQVVRI